MASSSIQSRNGVTRPGPRSVKCAAVWDYLDASPALTVREILEVGRAKGWNDENTRIEYYRWRQFHGLAKSQPLSAPAGDQLVRPEASGEAVTLDDTGRFTKILALRVPWAHSYADTRPGKTDRERREAYRGAAVAAISSAPPNVLWWAFRITVEKAGRPLDVDNVAKTIIDAFSGSQIRRDRSAFTQLALYPDDTYDHVRMLQVIGGRSGADTSTFIEIFARIRE